MLQNDLTEVARKKMHKWMLDVFRVRLSMWDGFYRQAILLIDIIGDSGTIAGIVYVKSIIDLQNGTLIKETVRNVDQEHLRKVKHLLDEQKKSNDWSSIKFIIAN